MPIDVWQLSKQARNYKKGYSYTEIQIELFE